MKPYKIKASVRTCVACPSQWEGITECGKGFYIRYRWGYLEVTMTDHQIPESLNDNNDDLGLYVLRNGSEVLGIDHGDSWKGEMSDDEMLDLVKSVLIIDED